MPRTFSQFVKQKNRHFFKAIFNLFIFLPYFFSFLQLTKTLFKPWKNLYTKKTIPGFSFQEWGSRLSFNLISSGVGFFMRICMITAYFFAQTLLVLSLPVIFIIYLISLPSAYFFLLFQKTEEEKKLILKEQFIKNHLLKEENRPLVENWFEMYYQTQVQKTPWWEIKNLFSLPPLARNWAVGYTPTLDQYGEEFTLGKPYFKNLVNREKEIAQIEQILSKADEANVIVVGEEGVGKHTIVEALAKRIFEGTINPILAYKRIIKVDMEKIISQSIDQSQKEAVLKTLFQEAADARNIIILIDNFDKYISIGEGRIDLTTAIEPFAKGDKIQLIGITSPFFYQKFVFPNETINRIFEKVDVFEVDQQDALSILSKTAFDFEKRFKVVIPYETLQEVIEKSDFYITHIPFPEKAIELLDETCVYATHKKSTVATPLMVDAVLTQKTHIPVNLNQSLKDKLLNLENLLSQKIIFQKEGIEKLSSALRKSFVVSGKRKKPLASFLFLGPTGVGKTETAKALAQAFFGSEKSLLRFDMSFYQTKEDISNLIGSAQSGNPGLLTKAVRERPYGVLLLDEIEKANKDLLNIFLTLLDEGYFTDGYGKRVDCKNLIVIATSNAGSDLIYKLVTGGGSGRDPILINFVIENKIFTPEFLNRFDGVIVYQPLTQQAITEIAKKMLTKIAEEVFKLHHVKINISDQFLTYLSQKGFDQQFGARNMERVIRDEVEDKIAKLVLENKVREGEAINF